MEQRACAILAMAKQLSTAEFKRGARPHEIPERLDCSSFVQYVFARIFNVAIPRRAFKQAECGEIVECVEELRPGDLLFFEGNPPSREHVVLGDRGYWVGHVAIYAGNGQVAHCTRKNGVRAALLSEVLEKKLTLIKRII